MSKSLKNFITIKDFLNNASLSSEPATDLRIFFLQHKYDADLHYSADRIREASSLRIKVQNFTSLCSQLDRETPHFLKYTSSSSHFGQILQSFKNKVLCALADDLDVPLALCYLSELIGEGHKYIQLITSSEKDPQHPVEPLLEAQVYLVDTFNKLGVSFSSSASSHVRLYTLTII